MENKINTPMTGNGNHSTYENGDDEGIVDEFCFNHIVIHCMYIYI